MDGSVFAGFGYAAAGITLIIIAIVTAASLGGQGVTVRDRILNSPSLAPLLIIHYFLPYGLTTFVLFMDIMSQLPQGIFGLLVAIFAFWVNYAIGLTYTPVLPPNDLCEIPGLKGMSSQFLPQSLLFVSIIVSYLASFITNSNPGIVTPDKTVSAATTYPSPTTRIGASWGLAASVAFIQFLGIVLTPGCTFTPINVFGFEGPSWLRPLFAMMLGFGIGYGSGYGFSSLSFTQPSYNVPGPSGSGVASTGPGFVRERFQLGSGLGEMPTSSIVKGGDVPIDIAKSSGAVTPGESSDQFVCEAYKNGQLVTSTLVG